MIVWQDSIYALPSLVAGLAALAMCVYIVPQRKQRLVGTFLLLCLAVAWWSLIYTLQILAKDLGPKLFFVKIQYLGIVLVPPLWFFFGRAYADKPPLRSTMAASIIIFPFITWLIVLTDSWHHLFWTEIRLIEQDRGFMLETDVNLWFWVHVVYSYGAICFGSYYMLQRAIRGRLNIITRQAALMILSALLPLIANILYIFRIVSWDNVDLTSIGFTVSTLIAWIGVIRYRVLDPIGLARERLIDLLDQLVIILDEHDRILELNPAAQTFFTAAPQRIGTNIQHLFARFSVEGLRLDLPKQQLQLRDIPFEWSIMPYTRFDGEPQGVVLLGRDLTEQLQAQQELTSQKELFENLVAVATATTAQPDLHATLENTLNISVSITGADEGSIFLLNEQKVVERSILIRKNMPAAQQAKVIDLVFEEGFAAWIVKHEETSMIVDTKRDKRWLNLPDAPYRIRSVLGVPIRGTKRLLGMLLLFHEQPGYFTQDHVYQMEAAAAQIALSVRNAQVYEQQKELTLELQRARDLAEAMSLAKSQFIANMSHELRTPLNAVIGYSDMLIEDITEAQDPFVRSSLQKISAAGQQLLGLVNDVLDVARIEAGRMPVHWDYVDPTMLVESVWAVTKPQIEARKNTFTSTIDPQLAMFLCDYAKIQRILVNLVGNATKFTLEGTIELRMWSEEHMICFSVSDSGIGMSAEQLEQIFEPFTQADASTTREYGGTGLGLTITRNLVQLLGGTMSVTSELGIGSTFTIRLPFRQDVPK